MYWNYCHRKNSKAVIGKMVSRYTLYTVESRVVVVVYAQQRTYGAIQYAWRRAVLYALLSTGLCGIVLLPALPNQEDETDRKKHAKKKIEAWSHCLGDKIVYIYALSL